MTFTVASWNVEFFGSRRPGETKNQVRHRIDAVFDYLATEIDADVYAIYEVNGGQVFHAVKAALPDYSWQITEGSGVQQILVGFRVAAFVTQRLEFSRGFAGPLRPGLLVTVTDGGVDFPMLFLHLKSKTAPIDFGVRSYQHDKARSLRKALDAVAAPQRAPFIVVGDLNTLGMTLTYSSRDITIADEIARLEAMYGSLFDDMTVCGKTHPATFWNGPGSSDPPADLDHVVASNRVALHEVAPGATVEVRGWPQEVTPAAQRDWIRAFSDHALLRFTVDGTQD